MGQLSFLLGHFEHDDNLNLHNGLNIGIPRWFTYLESKGIPQSWQSSLQGSTVCDFSSRCPRVGIFLDFLDDHKGRQPQVNWYTHLNIPVWYPWTTSHEKAVQEKPRFGHLQPPVELLQVAATFVVRSPTAILPSALLPSSSPPHPQPHGPRSPQPIFDEQQQQPNQRMDNSSSSDMTAAVFGTKQAAYIATKPWLEFFQARDELNKKKKETTRQRQLRLDRETKPPQKRSMFFSGIGATKIQSNLSELRSADRRGKLLFSHTQIPYWSMIYTAMCGMLAITSVSKTTTILMTSPCPALPLTLRFLMLSPMIKALQNDYSMKHSSMTGFFYYISSHLLNNSRNSFCHIP